MFIDRQEVLFISVNNKPNNISFFSKKGMPADDEYFKEYHSHVYGPVGIFMMDIRGNRITGDGVQHSDNNLVSDDQWESLGTCTHFLNK